MTGLFSNEKRDNDTKDRGRYKSETETKTEVCVAVYKRAYKRIQDQKFKVRV